MKLFVDMGAFIALTDADDENHKAAAAFYRNAKEKGTRFVTTNFVVCETMNYLRARGRIQGVVSTLFTHCLHAFNFSGVPLQMRIVEFGLRNC
jgi:predicted nucleic acid-binding protein